MFTRQKTLITLIFATVAFIASANEWSLPGIFGHAPNIWQKTRDNWTWYKGNPYKVGSGEWSLAYQTGKNPELTTKYIKMQQGIAWDYHFVWRGDSKNKNPKFYYLDKTLLASGIKGACSGPASAILFSASNKGTYQLELVGKVKVQCKTAGFARLTVYKLSADGKLAKKLKTVDLNNQGGYKGLPEKYAFSLEVILNVKEQLGVRIQTINPGPASAGKSSITFNKFKIKLQ